MLKLVSVKPNGPVLVLAEMPPAVVVYCANKIAALLFVDIVPSIVWLDTVVPEAVELLLNVVGVYAYDAYVNEGLKIINIFVVAPPPKPAMPIMLVPDSLPLSNLKYIEDLREVVAVVTAVVTS